MTDGPGATATIGGREYVLGAAYAPAEPVAGQGQRRAARRLLVHEPPGSCTAAWYAVRGGRVRTATLSGAPLPAWSGDHWAAWAGERISPG